MFIRDLDHVDLAIKVKVGAGHRQCRTPLSGASLCGNALQALFFCIICLGNGGIQFMASGCIVSLKFVVNMSGRIQCFFKTICSYKRRRTVHFIKIPDFFRYIDKRCRIIQFLFRKFFTENVRHFLKGHRLKSCRIQDRSRFVFHMSTYIVPLFWHLILFQIDFVRYFL